MSKSTLLIYEMWNVVGSPYRKTVLIAVVLIFISSLIEMVSIGAVVPLLNIVVGQVAIGGFGLGLSSGFDYIKRMSIYEMSLLFCVIFVIAGCVRLFVMYYCAKFAFKLGRDISNILYRNIINRDYSKVLEANSSFDISLLATHSHGLIYQVIMPVIVFVSSLITGFFIVLLLMYVSIGSVLIISFSFALMYLLILYVVNSVLKRNSSIIERESFNVVKCLQEGFGGSRDVLLCGLQKYYEECFRRSNNNIRMSQMYNHFAAISPRIVIESFSVVVMGVVVIFLYNSGSMSLHIVSTIGIIALGGQRLIPIMQQMYNSIVSINGFESQLAAIAEIVKEQPCHSCEVFSRDHMSFQDSIIFDNVSFRYGATLNYVLKGLAFRIQKGARVGIIGETGSGKTTLIDILMGLLISTDGQVLVDDEPIGVHNSCLWQKHIAHVSQQTFLVDESIAKNIVLGSESNNIDIEKIKNVASFVKLADFIDTLNDKYDTIVGERGCRLSGGQIQRIGIARALYRDADVIVFDEPSSALDSTTSKDIFSLIGNFPADITIIIVTHDYEMLSMCDIVIELKDNNLFFRSKINA